MNVLDCVEITKGEFKGYRGRITVIDHDDYVVDLTEHGEENFTKDQLIPIDCNDTGSLHVAPFVDYPVGEPQFDDEDTKRYEPELQPEQFYDAQGNKLVVDQPEEPVKPNLPIHADNPPNTKDIAPNKGIRTHDRVLVIAPASRYLAFQGVVQTVDRQGAVVQLDDLDTPVRFKQTELDVIR